MRSRAGELVARDTHYMAQSCAGNMLVELRGERDTCLIACFAPVNEHIGIDNGECARVICPQLNAESDAIAMIIAMITPIDGESARN